MTEGERIIKLETQMDNIEKKVDDGFETVLKRLDSLDEKYASKYIERIVWGVCGVVGTAVVLEVLNLIFNHAK